ncbi:MAG: ABC transporter transmembrane domain-containing protein [Gammaproteobacteria bacterium]
MALLSGFYLVTWTGERFIADIRQAVFNHVINLPLTFFEERGVGDLQSGIITDTTLLQQFIGSSLSLALRNILIFLGGLCLLLTTNYQLSLIALLLMPIVIIPLLFFGHKVKRLSHKTQQQVGLMGSFLNEALHNIKTLQAFNYQPYAQQKFAANIQLVLQVAKQRIAKRAWLVAIVIILIMTAVMSLLWIGGRWVLEGSLSGGELAAFVFYAILVAGSAGTLSEVYSEWQQVKGASVRLLGLLAIPTPSVPDNKILKLDAKPAKLNIQHLTFQYPTRAVPAIEDLSLAVAPGESLAFVGPSGAGKSTLVSLLLGFYSAEPNSIFLDDQDITKISLRELRQQIAWVSQEPAIFSGTIFENIAYGKPDATREAILAAAKSAYVTEFVEQLPNQYETLVGEGGVRLSGGQRQRIALARALLKQPRLLLLDEPTSALDSISEQMIQRALKEIMSSCTTIVIAHRLATVKSLHQIAVLNHGKLIALGSHDELLANNSLYAELAHLQFIVPKQNADS